MALHESWLPLALVLAGASIAATLVWLRRGAHHLQSLQAQLVAINDQLGHDPLALPEHAAPLLACAGVRGLRWSLHWYGQPLQGQAGVEAPDAQATPPEWHHRLTCGSLHAELWLAGAHLRGERRYFAQTLAQTLVLLWAGNLWRHDATVQASLARLGRLKTMLAHDVKNLAQFVQLLADHLQPLQQQAPQAWPLIEPLATAAMQARQRAERIVRALRQPDAAAGAAQAVSLARAAHSAAAVHGLALRCGGDATVRADPEALDTILDNLLKNLVDAARREGRHARAELTITPHGDMAQARLYDPGAGPAPALHRLFEPLYSTDPAGLGLGLWTAREWALSQSATLHAETDAEGRLVMVLHWPLSPPATAADKK